MADLEKTVKIILAGEDKLSSTLTSVSTGIDKLGSKVSSATQPLADMTDKILKIDAVIAGLAAGALALAVKNAGEFGDSFAEISTLIDAPADRLNEFKNTVLEYSRNSVTSLEGITTATYNIISATGDWENSITLLTAAERLNVAGKGELEDTTKLLVSSLNAYGKSANDAADFSDILFTGVRVGQTTMTELSASLGTVTGLASSAQVPFDQLTAAVSGLTGTLGNTSLAVTQVKGILAAVIKPSEQAKKAADDLNIAFDSQTLAAKGLQPFLQDIYNATGGNTDIMAKLFGRVEALNGALVLGADTSGKYADALQGMEDRAGATTEAYEKMAQNFSLINQNLVNNLKATLIDFGTPYLEEWGEIAGGLSSIFQGVSIGIDEGAFAEVFDMIETFASKVARDLELIAQAMPEALSALDWTELRTSLEGLGGAIADLFKDFFGEVDLTKPEDLAKVVQQIVDGIGSLVDITKGIAEGMGPFIAKLGDMARGFNELDTEQKSALGNILGMGKAINEAAKAIPLLTAPLKLLSGAVSLLAVTRIPALITSFGSMSTAIGTGGAVSLGLLGPVTLLGGALATLLALTPNTAIGGWARENVPLFKEWAETIDRILLSFSNFDDEAATAAEESANLTQSWGDAFVEIAKWIEDMNKPIEPVFVVTGGAEFQAEVDLLTSKIKAMPDSKETVLSTAVDKPKVEADVAYVTTIVENPDGSTNEIKIPVKLDSTDPSIDDTKKKIEAATPSERITIAKLEGEVAVDIAKIQAQADTLQSAFEWQAKLDIAEVEAGVERFLGVASNVRDMFADTGNVLASMVGALTDASGYAALVIQEALEAESKRRDELLVLQKGLTQAEIDLTKARTKAFESGAGLINIQASGVYPELELVLQKIIERAQVQANAEGMAFLLGG